MPRKQTVRKRRVHTRSRNGCVTCKAKHLRCDEQKPLCGRCLASGGSCGYVDRSLKHSQSPQPSDGTISPKVEELEIWEEDFSFAPVPHDLTLGYPYEASHNHSQLFDILTRYRGIAYNSHAIALSSPALLHCALLLSALRWTWYSGSNEYTNESILHHKLEAIKYINESIQNPTMVATEATIISMAALAMAESGLGRPETTHAHLHGLSQVLAARVPMPCENGALLHKMILCTTQGLSKMTMREIFNLTQPIKECANTLTLFIEPEVQILSEDPLTWDSTVAEIISTKSYRQRTDWMAPRSEVESRARFLQCCLRVVTLVGPGNLDFFTLNWFIQALIDEITMSENAMLGGNFPRCTWLWAAMMTRAAAMSVQPCSPSEEQQIDEWTSIANEKIRIFAKELGFRTWQNVESLLRTWVLHGNLLNTQQLRGIWEDALLSRVEPSDGILTPTDLDKHQCLPTEERKPIIIDDEAFDQCIHAVWR